MAGGIGAPRYSFDLRVAQARDEINDALRKQFGQPQQPMMQQPMAPQMGMQPQMPPGMMPQQPQMAPGMAPQQPQMAPQQPQMAPGMAPQMGMQQPMAPQPFQEGGLATSLRTNPADHERDVAFVASRDQQLRDMIGKRPFARGGYAEGGDVEGDIVVQGRRPAFNETTNFDLARLMSPAMGFSGFGAEPTGGGALNAAQRLPNLAYVEPKGEKPAIMPAVVRSATSPLAELAGMKAPRGYGAKFRSTFAKGGGAWTRKEGQNPEGGLNAVGRASLRAQGHDIKPPVSAKQAKKSPKAAARRKSFCARMSGMPGPMKDENGKPTRKALSLRKWDC